MRARKMQPAFDRLDVRLVLDSGSTVIAGGNLGASVLPMLAIADASVDGSGQTDLTTVVNWYLPGTPPPATYDPSSVSLPWNMMPTN